MTVFKMLLCLLAGVGAIFLICWVILWFEKNFASEKYDERQQLARGRAYRAAYCVGIVWIFVSLFYIVFGGDTDGLLMVLYLGFVAQAMTFDVYCLLTHASLPLSKKPLSSILSYAGLAVIYGINTITGIEIDARYPDKPQMFTLLWLSLVVLFGTLCVLHLIQYLRDKKE